MTSPAETLLAVQLEQAGIPFEQEYRFAPPRRWRADFWLHLTVHYSNPPQTIRTDDVLVEIDGGGYVAGRHSRGGGMEDDCEKTSAAAILGYRVIRLTPRMVDDGRGLLWIKQALGMEDARADAS